jgi:hypothetical protein
MVRIVHHSAGRDPQAVRDGQYSAKTRNKRPQRPGRRACVPHQPHLHVDRRAHRQRGMAARETAPPVPRAAPQLAAHALRVVVHHAHQGGRATRRWHSPAPETPLGKIRPQSANIVFRPLDEHRRRHRAHPDTKAEPRRSYSRACWQNAAAIRGEMVFAERNDASEYEIACDEHCPDWERVPWLVLVLFGRRKDSVQTTISCQE